MKVIFVVPNYHCGGMEAIQGPMMNLGPLFAASPVIEEGHQVEFFDLTIRNLCIDESIEEILACNPDLVGIAARTHLLNEALRIGEGLKNKRPSIKILMGGIHVTFMYMEVLKKSMAVDFILRNEAEHSILHLIRSLEAQKDDLSTVPNLVWRDLNGNIQVNETVSPLEDLDRWRPAYELVKDWDLYSNRFTGHKSAVVQFSRGCNQKCKYCTQWAFWNHWRACSPAVFADELEMLNDKFGVRYFLLADESPQLDKELWKEVLKEVGERRINDSFIAGCSRAKDIIRDKDILDQYAKAGFLVHLLGAEFTSNKTLENTRKEQKIDDIKEAVRLIRENGMVSIIDIMLGWGDEDENIRDKMAALEEISADFICFFWTTPYPWTEAHKELVGRAQISGEFEEWNFMKSFNDGLNQKKIEKEILSFYFKHHFNLKRLYHGMLRGPRKRRQVYRAIFFQGLRRAITQKMPILHKFVGKKKDMVVSLHNCVKGLKFMSGSLLSRKAGKSPGKST